MNNLVVKKINFIRIKFTQDSNKATNFVVEQNFKVPLKFSFSDEIWTLFVSFRAISLRFPTGMHRERKVRGEMGEAQVCVSLPT